MIRAAIEGFRRALGSPWLIVGVWLLTVLAALPATLVLRDSLHESLGRTLAAENMAEGFDSVWYGEYNDEAEGIAGTFNPTVAGVGGVLSNLEGWADGGLTNQFAGLVGLGIFFAVIWALLLGAAIERYAFDDAPRGFAGVIGTGARYWMRFLRLALLALGIYVLVYRLHHWAMDVLGRRLIDVTEETTAMWGTLLIYGLTALLLVVVRACFDYAKIAIVVDGRRSALFAAFRGIAFVVRHPLSTMGLVLLIAIVAAVPLVFYVALRPSTVTSGSIAVLYPILLGQAWIVTRLTLRLSLLGGQTALYQSAAVSSSATRGK